MTPPAPKRTRRSQVTITGRLVPPGSSPPNPDHPLALLAPEERLDVALEALGKLILGVMEDELKAVRAATDDRVS